MVIFDSVSSLLQISARGAQRLAIVLETNKVLEHLALNNCDLGDEGVEPIATGGWSQGSLLQREGGLCICNNYADYMGKMCKFVYNN